MRRDRKPFTGHTILKTYGDMWMHDKKNDEYTINLNQLMNGISQDYLFDLFMPATWF